MKILLDVILNYCDYQGRMSRNSEDDLCIFRRFFQPFLRFSSEWYAMMRSIKNSEGVKLS